MKKDTALNYLLYLLSRRDYSEKEIRIKLKQKEYSQDEIDNAISIAQQNHWQSDERFCSAYLHYRSLQGYGPRRLRQELLQKGVKSWVIEQEIENCEIDWYQIAEQIFNKKQPNNWNLKTKQKIWRYMISHGFTSEYFSHLIQHN